MATEDKAIATSASVELDQNTERVSRQLETQIIGATRIPFVDKNGRLKANTPGASQIAIITTNTPQELDSTSKAMTGLARRGIHGCGKLDNVLFVDCGGPVSEHFPQIKFDKMFEKDMMKFYRDGFTIGTLRTVLTAVWNAGVDIKEYLPVTEKERTELFYATEDREYGAELARRMIPRITKELAMAKDPIHLFPVFAFGQEKPAETFVVLEEITGWNSEGTTEGFVGPWGSTFVIPNQTLSVLEKQDSGVVNTLRTMWSSSGYPLRLKGHRLPAVVT